jgi:histidine ammonia-lyase
MLKSLGLTLPLCALIMGCQTTSKQNACDGFAQLRPKLETTVYILQNDRPFANDVAAHNRMLSSLGCGN